ncbi:MAG TPA: choice-of-anchor tandem repeat GloVer-containing protein, partial [Candidatus Cybelea sp.]|nr:choice-of-anchor tandem repeat GloVer-containing protein [Candidatus Cybelea sp.]
TLYGTTEAGGGSPCSLGGCGTVYSLSTSGKERVLYRFTGGSDGAYPDAGLIEVNGALYGTTFTGGSSGVGTVYSISTRGVEKVLHGFTGGSDGASPLAELIDVKDTLYGTTANGGVSTCPSGCGTVYSINTSGKEKVLYGFTGGSDGAYPEAPLIEVNGKLYGTTFWGGGLGCYSYGCGTIYQITTAGAEEVSYAFKRDSDGSQPAAGLIYGNGTLYGTTVNGGVSRCSGGCGTVYSVSPTGVEKVLHRFSGGSGGAEPQAGLIDVNGALYDTTSSGGADCYGKFGCGIVFALRPGLPVGFDRRIGAYSHATNGVPWLPVVPHSRS